MSCVAVMISYVLKTNSDSSIDNLILVFYFGEIDWWGGVVWLLPKNHAEAKSITDGCLGPKLGHPPGYRWKWIGWVILEG